MTSTFLQIHIQCHTVQLEGILVENLITFCKQYSTSPCYLLIPPHPPSPLSFWSIELHRFEEFETPLNICLNRISDCFQVLLKLAASVDLSSGGHTRTVCTLEMRWAFDKCPTFVTVIDALYIYFLPNNYILISFIYRKTKSQKFFNFVSSRKKLYQLCSISQGEIFARQQEIWSTCYFYMWKKYNNFKLIKKIGAYWENPLCIG